MLTWISNWFHKKCNETIAYLNQELAKLRKLQMELDDIAEYWNNKWPKANITYSARPLPNKQVNVNWDVRNFIWGDNAQLKDIVDNSKLKAKTYNKTALNCLEWVIDNVKYISDTKEQGLPEFWLFPAETLKLRKGDCEDGAILLASLMRSAGIPAYRVKLCAGYVEYLSKLSGHAYPIFLRDDDTWCVLDWCYWPMRIPLEQRKEHKAETKYREIWWTCNDKFSWAQHDVRVTARSLKCRN